MRQAAKNEGKLLNGSLLLKQRCARQRHERGLVVKIFTTNTDSFKRSTEDFCEGASKQEDEAAVDFDARK